MGGVIPITLLLLESSKSSQRGLVSKAKLTEHDTHSLHHCENFKDLPRLQSQSLSQARDETWL